MHFSPEQTLCVKDLPPDMMDKIECEIRRARMYLAIRPMSDKDAEDPAHFFLYVNYRTHSDAIVWRDRLQSWIALKLPGAVEHHICEVMRSVFGMCFVFSVGAPN